MSKVAYEWYKKFRVHILIWTVFILYETVVIGLIFGVFGHPVTYLGHYYFAILLFYIHADLILPWALNGSLNTIWRTPLMVIFEIWLYILCCFLLDRSLVAVGIIKQSGPFTLDITYQLKTLYRGLLFTGFGTGYYYLSRFIKEQEKTSELERRQLTEIIKRQKFEQQLAKTENDFLKAQINPHFLFNTLDFIYHKVLLVSPVAADTIIALSEMMRFAMDANTRGGHILLGEEIEQVAHLIFLNQLRKEDTSNFHFQAENAVHSLYMIPLVLLTLVENVFKHGDLKNTADAAALTIKIIEGHLIIKSSNRINLQYGSDRPKGNGLSNISQRLRYAYGERSSFVYKITGEEYFETFISIPVELLTVRKSSSDDSPNNDREPSPVAVDNQETID